MDFCLHVLFCILLILSKKSISSISTKVTLSELDSEFLSGKR